MRKSTPTSYPRPKTFSPATLVVHAYTRRRTWPQRPEPRKPAAKGFLWPERSNDRRADAANGPRGLPPQPDLLAARRDRGYPCYAAADRRHARSTGLPALRLAHAAQRAQAAA